MASQKVTFKEMRSGELEQSTNQLQNKKLIRRKETDQAWTTHPAFSTIAVMRKALSREQSLQSHGVWSVIGCCKAHSRHSDCLSHSSCHGALHVLEAQKLSKLHKSPCLSEEVSNSKDELLLSQNCSAHALQQ